VHLAVPITEPARAEQSARAGFVVSRAVGGAVVRNRVRRQLRHLVGPRLADLPAGATLVVRALPPAAGRSFAELGADLDAALASARRPPRQKRPATVERD
jgi:ribonuclease P protein component